MAIFATATFGEASPDCLWLWYREREGYDSVLKHLPTAVSGGKNWR